MGLKAGLQIIGKAIAKYADDAARLATQSGDDVAKAVATKADDAISVFGQKADDVVGVFAQNTDDFVKNGKATVPPQVSHASAVASHSVDEAGNVVLKEHGLSEIMKETAHTPTPIGQTPVHSPIHPQKIDPNLARLFDSLEGSKPTGKMSKKEMEQMFEELKKHPRDLKPTSTTPVETWLEKTIKGLAEPEGLASRRIALDDKGNTIVSFLDGNGSFIRKVKISPDGQVLEYSNFRTLMSGQGIRDACITGNLSTGGRFSERLYAERILSETSFDELGSEYMRICEQSRYILDFDGNVTRSIQTRRFTPHIKGKIGETPTIVEIDTRSMSDGRFVEDVVLTRGDKRFSHSFWFDQKTGSVLRMDGWCKGISKEEIEIIKSDPYLASRYIGDGLDFVRTEKFNAFKTQGLRDKQTPLTFNVPDDPLEAGHYGIQFSISGRMENGHINMSPNRVIDASHSEILNTLHHEPRHGFQHQMVDALKAGLLQGEEKVQAEIFAENFRHYKTMEKHGFKAYYEQPVEVDARHYGEIAERQFEEIGEKIDKIFFDI